MADRLPTLTLVGVTSRSREIEVHYTVSAPEVDAVRPRLRSVCERFSAENGARGAFGEADSRVPEGTLALIDDGIASSGSIVQRLASAALDGRAFQCLRNMVRRLKRDDIVVTSIIVVDPQRRSAQEQRIEWPTDLNEERAYPDALPAIRSLMTWEEADFGRDPTLSRRNDYAPKRRSRPGVGLDSTVVSTRRGSRIRGADRTPRGSRVYPGTVNQFDDHVIEVGMARLLASEKAWNALANITLTLWGPSGVRRILVD